ncbi:DUF6719 family protein [Neorhizobium alkalisoli]|uniref:DUF6719 family protein n=1 Tax=Neorhizobium alkalisoli TaxID=528178 RepID=UPI00387E685D
MSHFTIALSSAVILLASIIPDGAHAQRRRVFDKPTISSVPDGTSVFYDDGKCPKGQIARFHKRLRREELTRQCVPRRGKGQGGQGSRRG